MTVDDAVLHELEKRLLGRKVSKSELERLAYIVASMDESELFTVQMGPQMSFDKLNLTDI